MSFTLVIAYPRQSLVRNNEHKSSQALESLVQKDLFLIFSGGASVVKLVM